MNKLSKEETELVGQWYFNGSETVSDSVCERIEWLIENQLKEIITNESGWDILYQDPNDDRYWELIYPQSHMHGGGPPSLKYIDGSKVKERYKIPPKKE